jgi:hypothetical protein
MPFYIGNLSISRCWYTGDGGRLEPLPSDTVEDCIFILKEEGREADVAGLFYMLQENSPFLFC